MNISNHIRNARVDANLKQLEVMDKIGISNKNLSNWENGVSLPCLEDAIKLADLYGVSLDELTGHRVTNMREISTEDKLFFRSYARLNDTGKKRMQEFLCDILQIPSYTEKEAASSAS